MKTIKSVDPIQYGKVMAVIMAIVLFVEGIFFTIVFTVFGAMGGIGSGTAFFAGMGFVGGILFTAALVIGGLVGGFVMGVIGALIYNFIASKIGGIKIELD